MRRAPFLAMLALPAAAAIACPRERETEPAPVASASSATQSASASPSASGSADTVSQASPTASVWDAGAKVVVGSSVDGAALRARNRARLAKDVSPVIVLRGDDPLTLGTRICAAVVPKRAPETPILLKPNLGGFDWFKDPAKHGGDDGLRGRITDPEFVRGVVRCLKARGHTKITIAEGWGATHAAWLKLVKLSGYAAMATEEGVSLVAMDDDGVFDVAEGQPGKPLGITGMEKTQVPTLLMPKLLAEHLEHGLFISIPKIKAHRFGVVSMSVKGMQGTVMLSDASPAFRQKWRMHRELNPWLDARKKSPPGQTPEEKEDRASYVHALETFAERIADVLEIEAPHVVLADGTPAMGGDGFQRMYPSAEKVAIGGTNAIRVDRVGAAFLGLWKNQALAKELLGHATSPLLEVAAKRFGVDLDDVAVEGDGADLLAHPRPVHFVGMAKFEIHSEPAKSVNPEPPPVDFAREAHAVALGAAKIVVDGSGTDPAWLRTAPVSWSSDFSGVDTGVATTARFVWSGGALYVLFELEGAGLNADTTKPIAVEREKLWSEDCVELFLDVTKGSPKSYHEIEVGPFGHFLDLALDDKAEKKSDVAWSGDLLIGASRNAAAKTATIEVAIRSPDITSALSAGARFPLGLFRMEGKTKRHYLAWSPPRTAKPNFHVPEAFGTLVLDAP